MPRRVATLFFGGASDWERRWRLRVGVPIGLVIVVGCFLLRPRTTDPAMGNLVRATIVTTALLLSTLTSTVAFVALRLIMRRAAQDQRTGR